MVLASNRLKLLSGHQVLILYEVLHIVVGLLLRLQELVKQLVRIDTEESIFTFLVRLFIQWVLGNDLLEHIFKLLLGLLAASQKPDLLSCSLLFLGLLFKLLIKTLAG